MNFDFKNKNIIITGGSRGIGSHAAKIFSQAGANVMITYKTDRNAAEVVLKVLENGNNCTYQLDISKVDEICEFYKFYSRNYSGLDILVNNAGIYKEHKMLEESYETWWQIWKDTLQTNLEGAANMCYFASRLMMKKKKGKIINISSRGAFRGEPDCPAYGASKAGLNAMSQSIAPLLAPYGISVHTIAPGFVETEMTIDMLGGASGAQIKQQSPFGRVAKAEEVANLIAALASDELEFTSGGIIDINGASYFR